MSKLLLLSICLVSALNTNVQSQTLTSDSEFLKTNLYMQNMIIILDDVYNSSDQSKISSENLAMLNANLTYITKHYNAVKAKYEQSKGFKTFQENVEGLRKSKELLQKKDPSWAMLFYLIKLNIQDLVNKELE